MNPKKDGSFTTSLLLLFIILVVVFVVWLIFPIIVHNLFKPEDSGKFGDLFGSLNALFAGLAFAVITYAIFLQREDLKIQKKDLELTRQELKLSREELSQQTRVISAQLEAMQQSLDIEQQNRMKEIAPVLVGKGVYIKNQKNITITNTGGRISNLSCLLDNPKTGITPKLNKEYVDQNGDCELTLSGYGAEHRPEVILNFTYFDVDGNIWSEKFKVPEGTTSDLIPIHGSKEFHP